MSRTLGIDLGGTNIAAGLVEDGRILDAASVKTRAPRPAEALCDDMAALCRELAARNQTPMGEIPWVGIGTPGIVWGGTLSDAANLGLATAPLADLLAARLEKPVFLANDANAAALGESLAGAGRGSHSLVVLTIGTGIGSGIILEGKIHTGFNGAAAELGHMMVQPGGEPCRCGRRGCLERYCSATALIRETRKAAEQHPDSLLWRHCRGDLANVSGRTAFAAAREGDKTAQGVLDTFLDYLALGTANVINLLQPEVFALGGGVSREGEPLLAPLRERVERLTFAGREGLRTRVVAATLGNDAGILGAAMLGAAGN